MGRNIELYVPGIHEIMSMRCFVTLFGIQCLRQSWKLWGKPVKSSTISKDVPYEIRTINRMNAVKFRSVTVEDTLSGYDSCHLNCKYCLLAAVAPVMHIQMYFTWIKIWIISSLPSIFVTTELLHYADIVHLNHSIYPLSSTMYKMQLLPNIKYIAPQPGRGVWWCWSNKCSLAILTVTWSPVQYVSKMKELFLRNWKYSSFTVTLQYI
jgi:hypothetical protein